MALSALKTGRGLRCSSWAARRQGPALGAYLEPSQESPVLLYCISATTVAVAHVQPLVCATFCCCYSQNKASKCDECLQEPMDLELTMPELLAGAASAAFCS